MPPAPESGKRRRRRGVRDVTINGKLHSRVSGAAAICKMPYHSCSWYGTQGILPYDIGRCAPASVQRHQPCTRIRRSSVRALSRLCMACASVELFITIDCSFLSRDAILARYMPWPRVRVCLCLSQVGVLLKRLNTRSHK